MEVTRLLVTLASASLALWAAMSATGAKDSAKSAQAAVQAAESRLFREQMSPRDASKLLALDLEFQAHAGLWLDWRNHGRLAAFGQWERDLAEAYAAMEALLSENREQWRQVTDDADWVPPEGLPFDCGQPVSFGMWLTDESYDSVRGGAVVGEFSLRVHRYIPSFHDHWVLYKGVQGKMAQYRSERENVIRANNALEEARALWAPLGLGELIVNDHGRWQGFDRVRPYLRLVAAD